MKFFVGLVILALYILAPFVGYWIYAWEHPELPRPSPLFEASFDGPNGQRADGRFPRYALGTGFAVIQRFPRLNEGDE